MFPQSSILQRVIRVDLGPTSYDAVLGYGNTVSISKYLRAVSTSKNVFVVTDSKVRPLHGEKLLDVLKNDGLHDIHLETVPEGESSKSIDGWTHLLGRLHHFMEGKQEKPLILNVGGGMVGDLGGFVAATYTRGCPYVQVPTSLMAMVDSSLGGKVGIDYHHAKNIIGSFYQPRLVFVDIGFLRTLDAREMRSGLAEVVKYGVIKDSALFESTEANYRRLLAADPDALFPVVAACLEIKARVVERDPLDQHGVRIILNYGHSIGHAVEAASEYRYKHGEAIAIGMAGANTLATRLGLLSQDQADRINNLLVRLGLPVRAPELAVSPVLSFLTRDKKFTEGTNRFVLPTGIGTVKTVSGIDTPLIEQTVRSITTPSPSTVR